jgi:hypothetical protein
VKRCKYNYDGECNLKYKPCSDPNKCESFVEDTYKVQREGQEA